MQKLQNFSDLIMRFFIYLIILYFLAIILHSSDFFTLLIIPAVFITLKSPTTGIIIALFFILIKQKFTCISFLNTIFTVSIGAGLTVLIAYILSRFIFYKRKEKFLCILSAPFFLPSITIISVIHIFANLFMKQMQCANQIVIIILICICFMPNALYIILNCLKSININYFKTAITLNIPVSNIFKILEFPIIKASLFKSFILIFMLAINSFNIFFLNSSFHDIYTKIYNSIIIANEDLYDIVSLFYFINFCLVSFFYKVKSIEYNSPNQDNKKVIEKFFEKKSMILHGVITFLILIFIFFILLKIFLIRNFEIDAKIIKSIVVSVEIFICTFSISFIFLFFLLHAKSSIQRILQKLTLITSPFLLSILISEYTLLLSNFTKVLIISLVISIAKIPFLFFLTEKNFNCNISCYFNLIKNLNISTWTYIRKIFIPSIKIKSFTIFLLFICINELSAVMLIGNGSIDTLSSTISSCMYHYEFAKLESINFLVTIVGLIAAFVMNKRKI